MGHANLVLLKCSKDIDAHEMTLITSVCSLLGIDPYPVDKVAGETVKDKAPGIKDKAPGMCFDAVYLAGHGAIDKFGSSTACVDWAAVAQDLSSSTCLNPGATVFCACCRGGLLTIAKALLKGCQTVDFVCGSRNNISANALALGFHTLMYNVVFRHGDPIEAAHLATEATGQHFAIHDRAELSDRGAI